MKHLEDIANAIEEKAQSYAASGKFEPATGMLEAVCMIRTYALSLFPADIRSFAHTIVKNLKDDELRPE